VPRGLGLVAPARPARSSAGRWFKRVLQLPAGPVANSRAQRIAATSSPRRAGPPDSRPAVRGRCPSSGTSGAPAARPSVGHVEAVVGGLGREFAERIGGAAQHPRPVPATASTTPDGRQDGPVHQPFEQAVRRQPVSPRAASWEVTFAGGPEARQRGAGRECHRAPPTM